MGLNRVLYDSGSETRGGKEREEISIGFGYLDRDLKNLFHWQCTKEKKRATVVYK